MSNLVREVPIVMPDLGLSDRKMSISVWHVARERAVEAGAPLVEIIAGEVVVDLPSPQTGVLAVKRLREEDDVRVGQTLGTIHCDP